MTEPDSSMCFGDLAIDTLARSVRFGVDEIALTRREFDILSTLASHPGWVYSSETLASNEPSAYSSPSSVNVHVSRLRRKLAAAGCRGLIETVRGIGYRLRAPGASVPSSARPAASVPERRFVGREHEMGVLETAMAAATKGDARFVLVTGEPGLGKTRTAEELAERAPDAVLTAWGRCEPGGSPPYWLWIQILRTILDHVDQDLASTDRLKRSAATLSSLLHALGGSDVSDSDSAGLPSGQSTFVLCDTVTRALVEVSRQRPLLLVLDDLQWATESSLLLLEFVLRHLAEDKVMIVGLCRNTDGGTPALDRVLGECAQRRRSACMELRGLTAQEICEFAATRGLDDLVPEMAEAVMARTAGSPFLLTELVNMIAADGGGATASDLGRLAPSPNVRTFVRSRLARLTDPCVSVLRQASVFGPTFPMTALEEVAGLERSELLGLVSEALDARILAPTPAPGSFGFAHALVQQAVFLDVPIARRLQLHARVAEALAKTANAANPATAAIAYHYLQAAPAGYSDLAIEHALRAARESMALFAFPDAVYRCEEALALLAVESDSESRRGLTLESLEGHGDALAATARMERAAEAYESALDLASESDAARRGRLLGKLAGALVETRDWDRALSALDHADEEMEAIAEADRDEGWDRSWVDGEISRMWLYYYQLMGDEMRQHLSKNGRLIEERATPNQLADYLGVVVLWRILADRNWPTDETVEVARNALAAASASGSRARVVAARALFGYVLLWNGRLSDARTQLRDVPPHAKEVGAFLSLMIALAGLSLIGRLEGDTEAVAEHAPVSEAAAEELGSWREFGALGTADRAWLAWRRGDLEGARALARAAREVWDRVPAFSFYWAAVWPEMAASLELGDTDSAICLARKLVEPGQQLPKGELTDAVREAIEAADAGDDPRAVGLLRQAVAAGREFGYT
jgi:DNA-binding winged helix-turn-helix (wHTH) protein/tetratricopeptide (TPR) repeat protein